MKYLLILVIVLTVSFHGFSQKDPIESLARMEKEFSDYTTAHGGPEAWTKYFAVDGIMFAPQPVNAHELMKPRLGVNRPRQNRLTWEACFTDISSAGDLGYNIGPSVVESIKYDTVPKKYGFIFSVWKKVNDTTWRVAIDAGIGVKERTGFHALTGKYTAAAKKPAGKLRNTYLEAESKFQDHVLRNGFHAGFEKYLVEESKILRNEYELFTDKASFLKWAKANQESQPDEKAELKLIGSEVSKSNDLAYTYGTYSKSQSKEEGIFVHTWKRINGEWSLVVDVTGPLPKTK